MSNITPSEQQSLIWLLIGALMATLGGVFTEWIKIHLDEHRKTNSVKARLFVLIDKSVKSIKSIVETYEQSDPHLIHGVYIDKLKAVITLYDHISEDLYLLDQSLRDKIMEFFDKQNSLVSEVNELVSASGVSKEAKELQAEHDRKISTFRSLKSDGEQLMKELH